MLAAVTYCLIARANLVHTEFNEPQIRAGERTARVSMGLTNRGDAEDCAPVPEPSEYIPDENLAPGFIEGYKKHSDKAGFVVDVDDAIEWIGRSRKAALQVLHDGFVNDTDYVVRDLPRPLDHRGKAPRGGNNKKLVLMSVNTFKVLAANTRTAEAKAVLHYLFHHAGAPMSIERSSRASSPGRQ
jgi:hypothetical protein